METIERFLLSVKKAGLRKVAYGLAALLAIFALCFARRLNGGEFVACFVPLIGAVMAANYGEHREKKENVNATASDAPAPPTPPNP